jgi:hypothetical protein
MPPEYYQTPADFETTVATLRAAVATEDSTLFAEDIVAGTCSGGQYRFIFRFVGPFEWQYEYFDSASGAFVAVERDTSDVLAPCTHRYWPAVVTCPGHVVTDVIAGTRYHVGDGDGVLP